MWRPKYISFQNLLSHPDSEYFYPESGQTTIIQGINKDDGFESNGSGKSAFEEAQAIALSGDSIRNVKISDLVRNGEEETNITFLLENKFLNQELKIERKIYSGPKSSVCRIYLDGEEDSSSKDLKIDIKNKRIFELLGITKDDLMNYYIISKDTYTSFFSAGDTAKKEIINRFSNANLVDPVLEKVKEDITEKNSLKADKVNLLNRLSDQIPVLEQAIEEREREFEKNKKEKIEEIENDIEENKKDINNSKQDLNETEDSLKSENADLQTVLLKQKELNKQLGIKKKDLENFDQKKKVKLNEDLQCLREEIKELDDELSDLRILKKEIETHLQGGVVCPNCQHKFSLQDEEFNFEEAPNVLKELTETEIPSKEKERVGLKEKEKEIEDKLSVISEKYSEIKSQVSLIEGKIETEERMEKTINSSITRLQGQIEKNKVNVGKYEEKYRTLSLKLKTVKASKLEGDDTLDEKREELKQLHLKINDHQTQLKKIELEADELIQQELIFKKFKSYLANKSIGAIEYYANSYLQSMGTDMEVSIDGYRLLANQRVKEEITTYVSRDGLSQENFFKFSGGERARIDVSVILAMQYLINISSKTGGLDLLFLDEIVESVDGEGVRQVINCLSQLDKLIFVVTHTNPNQDFDHQLIFVKENGETRIQD